MRNPAPRLPAPCASVLFLLLVLGGCGGEKELGPYAVEEGPKRVQPDRPVPPGATTRDRFGLHPLIDYVAPEGWRQSAPTRLRVASLQIPGEGAEYADVSVTRFHGGALENLNRWRRQFGLESVTALDALPKTKVFGRPALRVELEGDFVGMGEGDALPGYALLGLIQEPADHYRWFVKMVGPKALVAAHRERFERFRASLRVVDAERPARQEFPDPPEPPPGGLDPGRIRWTLPPGWKEVPPSGAGRGIRVMSFRIEAAPALEGVLSHLRGQGGGVLPNINVWREQMGAAALSDADVAALPRVEVLGTQAVWIEIPGHFRGRSNEDVPDALFLGAICLLDKDAVFVRLTGPRAEVEARREEFRALCRSLRLEG